MGCLWCWGWRWRGGFRSRVIDVSALLSDGECEEGSVWEAALFAPVQKLDNVVAIVDYNKWQATGRSNEVTALQPAAGKMGIIRLERYEVDGHDVGALTDVLGRVPDGTGKPIAIIANTIKGKGVSFMEDDNNWHYRIPTADEVKLRGRSWACREKRLCSRHYRACRQR